MTLSGGMKRRLLIAKALSHEPQILFLDEPTAGVDVELRRDMWALVRSLRASGVTIILTTHYIDEAEEMADRIGVINKGEIILVEDKVELMRKLGKKQLTLQLQNPLERIPAELADFHLELASGGTELIYTYDTRGERASIAALLAALDEAGSASRISTRRKARWKISSSAWCERRNESARDPRDLRVRDGAHPAHADAERHLPGDFDIAVFRRLRCGDRLAHPGSRRDQLRRVHRPRTDHAVAADAKHLQRVVRHLLSASSSERSTSYCRRRFPISRSC